MGIGIGTRALLALRPLGAPSPGTAWAGSSSGSGLAQAARLRQLRLKADRLCRDRRRVLTAGMTLPRVQPIITTWRKQPFDGPGWLFDVKYDGFRAVCYVQKGRGRFFWRNGHPMGALTSSATSWRPCSTATRPFSTAR